MGASINQFRAFISYSSTELSFARRLARDLAQYEIAAYVATDRIPPASDWAEHLRSALTACDGLIAIISPDFRASEWTAQEVGYAMGANKPLIAIAFGASPFGFLQRAQAIQGVGRSATEVAKAIFECFGVAPLAKARLAEVIAEAFCKSDSYLTARRGAELLQRLPDPGYETLIKALDGLRSNEYVRNAEGVPKTIAGMISIHPQANELLDCWPEGVSPSE